MVRSVHAMENDIEGDVHGPQEMRQPPRAPASDEVLFCYPRMKAVHYHNRDRVAVVLVVLALFASLVLYLGFRDNWFIVVLGVEWIWISLVIWAVTGVLDRPPILLITTTQIRPGTSERPYERSQLRAVDLYRVPRTSEPDKDEYAIVLVFDVDGSPRRVAIKNDLTFQEFDEVRRGIEAVLADVPVHDHLARRTPKKLIW